MLMALWPRFEKSIAATDHLPTNAQQAIKQKYRKSVIRWRKKPPPATEWVTKSRSGQGQKRMIMEFDASGKVVGENRQNQGSARWNSVVGLIETLFGVRSDNGIESRLPQRSLA